MRLVGIQVSKLGDALVGIEDMTWIAITLGALSW